MKIVNCVCGCGTELVYTIDKVNVACYNKNGPETCWSGPERTIKKEAIHAWNETMSAAKFLLKWKQLAEERGGR